MVLGSSRTIWGNKMQRANPSAWSTTRYGGKDRSLFATDSEEEKSGKVNKNRISCYVTVICERWVKIIYEHSAELRENYDMREVIKPKGRHHRQMVSPIPGRSFYDLMDISPFTL